MPKTIYDKPTRALLKDMLTDLGLKPGQVFTSGRAVQWFAEHYPKLKPLTVRAHLVQASTNDAGRLHHTATNETDDLLFKVAPGQYRLYEVGTDPAPIHALVPGDVESQDTRALRAAEEPDGSGDALPGSSEFLLEKDLQNYLARNLGVIEPGLKLYVDEELAITGLEVDAGGRRIDILAIDKENGLVVLELKVSKGYDRVVGQLLRYVNWVRKELADPGQKVRGIILCRNMTEDLRLACADIPNLQLFEYQLSVTVSKVPAIEW